jgi:hypothetical protein
MASNRGELEDGTNSAQAARAVQRMHGSASLRSDMLACTVPCQQTPMGGCNTYTHQAHTPLAVLPCTCSCAMHAVTACHSPRGQDGHVVKHVSQLGPGDEARPQPQVSEQEQHLTEAQGAVCKLGVAEGAPASVQLLGRLEQVAVKGEQLEEVWGGGGSVGHAHARGRTIKYTQAWWRALEWDKHAPVLAQPEDSGVRVRVPSLTSATPPGGGRWDSLPSHTDSMS